MPRRIGLYGGSFDPVHVGHLISARSVAETLEWERVLFLPSSQPPNKMNDHLLDIEHRVAMVRLAIQDEPRLEFDDFDLNRIGPTYTLHTLDHFAQSMGDDIECNWLIGADTLLDLAHWHQIATLLDRYRIVTAARPGFEIPNLDRLKPTLQDAHIERLRAGILQTPRIDVAASDIRDRLRRGKSVRYLVPDRVHEYLLRHRLYAETAADDPIA